MDLWVVYSKTAKGLRARSSWIGGLSSQLMRVLSLIDGKSNVATLMTQADSFTEEELQNAFTKLESEGYIRPILSRAAEEHLLPPHETSAPMVVEEVYQVEEIEADTLDFTNFKADDESKPKAKEAAEAKAREEAEAKVRAEAERKVKEAAEARAKVEAERKAKEEAETKAKQEAERKAKEAAEAKAREEAEAKVRAEAERKVKEAAEARAKVEAERKAKEEAETKAKQEAERKAKEAAEAKAREEAEAKVRAEAERKVKEAAEARAKVEAERKAKEEAETKAKQEAERKAKEAAEAKAREEAEAKVRAEAERKVKEAAEARAKVEAERKAKEEAETKAKQEAERKAKEAAEAKAREEAEAKVRAEAERKVKEAAEARAKVEAERKAKEEAETKAKQEAERKAKEAAEAKAREEAEAKVRAEAERKVKEAAEARAKVEAERKAKEEAETKAKQEAERKAKEAAEAKAREEAEARAKVEAERKAKEEAETKAKQEAKARAKEEAKRKSREEIAPEAKEDAARKTIEDVKTSAEVKAEAWVENRINLAAIGKFLRAAGITVSAAILLLLVLLHVVNLSWFIPIEKLLSDKIGEPVTIGSVHSTLLPTPHLLLEDVSIGAAKDIKIAEIHVVPVLTTLLDNTKTLKYIEVESLTIPVESMDRAVKWLKTGRDPRKIKLGRIYLKNALVAVHGFKLAPFNAEIKLDKTDNFESAELKSTVDKILVEVTSKEDALQLNIAATAWQLPISTRFVLDELNAKATASRQGLQINEVDGWFHEGKLKGTATINWKNQWTVEGNFELSNANLASITALFTTDISLAGRLDLKGTYSVRSNNLPTLLDKPSIRADFSCLDGSIGGIDLVNQVLQGVGRENSGERSTRYTRLSGNMVLTDGRYQFRQIKLAGKQLSASGDVDMTANHTLSGNITADLAVKSRQFHSQLSLSGNLKQPQLK